MTKARRRVGPAPLRALFDLLRGPAATLAGQVRWRGLLVCAIDGTIMTVADGAANPTRFSKQRGGATDGSAYPMLRLVALVACGTRSIIDAVYGPITRGRPPTPGGCWAVCVPGCGRVRWFVYVIDF